MTVDRYASYQFRLRWEDRIVAAFARATRLEPLLSLTIEHRGGADPQTSVTRVSRVSPEPLTLERGVTHDAEFARWANTFLRLDPRRPTDEDVRRDLFVEVRDEAGALAQAFVVHDAWVSAFSAIPDLDAGADAIAIEHLKIEHEGITPDPPLTDPP